jgi:hypothetical protein
MIRGVPPLLVEISKFLKEGSCHSFLPRHHTVRDGGWERTWDGGDLQLRHPSLQ